MQDHCTPPVAIPLRHGYEALVDAQDAPRVLAHAWYTSWDDGHLRARARIDGRDVVLHRFILNPPPGVPVYFINGDSLDCRRSNIVVRTRAELSRQYGRQNRAEHNGQWKGDAARRESKHARARRLFRDLGLCEVCRSAPAIERHHRDGNAGHNAPENVIRCCRRCHMKEDGRLDAFLRRPQPPAGDDHPYNKLTKAQMAEVRQLLAQGTVSRAELARRYGVSWNVIDNIYRRIRQ